MSAQTKLKKYLDDNGIKAAWLAGKTGINYSRLMRIVNGSEPTASEAVAVSAALGKDVPVLFEIKTVDNAFAA